jgi:hypothetical protein
MKTLFKLGVLTSLFFLTSCGGEDDKSDKATAAAKPTYDCECNSLEKDGGGKFKIGSVKKMMKDNKAYTGTCAILSKDRDAVITFLAEYSEGYPVKKQKWQLFNGKKIQTWDLTFDTKNLKSGYTMNLKNEDLGLDSAKNKRHKVLYTYSYHEFNKGKQVLNYSFSDGGFYDTGNENTMASELKGEVITGSKEFTSLGDECWNKLPMTMKTTANIFTGEDIQVEVKDVFTWENYAKNEPAAKKYLECLQSKELKKFTIEEAFIDESATVGDVEAKVSDEDEE